MCRIRGLNRLNFIEKYNKTCRKNKQILLLTKKLETVFSLTVLHGYISQFLINYIYTVKYMGEKYGKESNKSYSELKIRDFIFHWIAQNMYQKTYIIYTGI